MASFPNGPGNRAFFASMIARMRVNFLAKTKQKKIDLVTAFDAILTSRQTRKKLQCLYQKWI